MSQQAAAASRPWLVRSGRVHSVGVARCRLPFVFAIFFLRFGGRFFRFLLLLLLFLEYFSFVFTAAR